MSVPLPPEGSDVSYVGPGELFGSQGLFLASANAYAGHVKWATGPRAGRIELVDGEDLVTVHKGQMVVHGGGRFRDDLEDSLEVGLPVLAARHIQDAEGTMGLLSRMASQGHLSGFAGVAEEALAHVAHRVRQDPGIREITAQLDEDEAEALVQLAAHSLIQQAFGDDDG